MTLTDVLPEARAELRAAGYNVETLEQAIAAAMQYLGASRESALVFLTGQGDRTVV